MANCDCGNFPVTGVPGIDCWGACCPTICPPVCACNGQLQFGFNCGSDNASEFPSGCSTTSETDCDTLTAVASEIPFMAHGSLFVEPISNKLDQEKTISSWSLSPDWPHEEEESTSYGLNDVPDLPDFSNSYMLDTSTDFVSGLDFASAVISGDDCSEQCQYDTTTGDVISNPCSAGCCCPGGYFTEGSCTETEFTDETSCVNGGGTWDAPYYEEYLPCEPCNQGTPASCSIPCDDVTVNLSFDGCCFLTSSECDITVVGDGEITGPASVTGPGDCGTMQVIVNGQYLPITVSDGDSVTVDVTSAEPCCNCHLGEITCAGPSLRSSGPIWHLSNGKLRLNKRKYLAQRNHIIRYRVYQKLKKMRKNRNTN
jgi:hypothetical protein